MEPILSALKVLRLADLKAAGVVTNWPQLRRLVENHGFPRGYLLSPACRVWDYDEIERWKESRRAASERRPSVTTAA